VAVQNQAFLKLLQSAIKMIMMWLSPDVFLAVGTSVLDLAG
jgi:hypothetical protein